MKSTKFLSSFIILFSLFSCSLEINKTTNVPLDVTSIFTAVRKTTHDQTSPIKLVATLTVENKYSDSQSIENVNSQDELNNQVIEFKNIPLQTEITINAKVYINDVEKFSGDVTQFIDKENVDIELTLKPVKKEVTPAELTLTLYTDETYSNDFKTIFVEIESEYDISNVSYVIGRVENAEQFFNMDTTTIENVNENYSFAVPRNGIYTVGVKDTENRTAIQEIEINHIDKTPPEEISSLTKSYDNDTKILTINWINPIDAITHDGEYQSPFNHIEITFQYCDGGILSDESEPEIINPDSLSSTYTIALNSYYIYYIYTIRRVDTVGNKSNGVQVIQYYNTSAPDEFVFVAGTSVTGPIQNSSVFIEGRTVEIGNFYICEHEVTESEYAIAITPESPKTSLYPQDCVSWYNAIVYCNIRSNNESLTPCYSLVVDGIPETDTTKWGKPSDLWNSIQCDFTQNGYRLPTETEWEYAARGGFEGIQGTQTLYSGSDTYTDVGCTSSSEIKKYAPNSLGIYDMSGTLEEWCWDMASKYDDNNIISITTETSSIGENSGDYRVLRGGYYNELDKCLLSRRNGYLPSGNYLCYGFRVVRSVVD